MKNFLIKNASKFCNLLALMLVVQSANSTCTWIIHQPTFPKEACKYKKHM